MILSTYQIELFFSPRNACPERGEVADRVPEKSRIWQTAITTATKKVTRGNLHFLLVEEFDLFLRLVWLCFLLFAPEAVLTTIRWLSTCTTSVAVILVGGIIHEICVSFLPKSTKVKVLLHAAALHLLFLFGIASVIQMLLLASPHNLQPEGTL